MFTRRYVFAACVVLLLAAAPALSQPSTLHLQGPTQSTSVPLSGMARNEDAVVLANQIQDNQAKLSAWQQKLDPTNKGDERLSQLAAKLQDDSIVDLRDGYNVANNASAPFPEKNRHSIDTMQKLLESITSHPHANDRVVTHISTTVAGATIHFRPYPSQANDPWSTYADGDVMDVGGYYFRVSTAQSQFQELYVVQDSPTTHKLAP